MFRKRQILSIFTVKNETKKKVLKEKIIKELKDNFSNKAEAKELLQEILEYYAQEHIYE